MQRTGEEGMGLDMGEQREASVAGHLSKEERGQR